MSCVGGIVYSFYGQSRLQPLAMTLDSARPRMLQPAGHNGAVLVVACSPLSGSTASTESHELIDLTDIH